MSEPNDTESGPRTAGEQPSVEDLAERNRRQFEAAARMIAMGDNDKLRGAMLVVADEDGIQTHPFVAADEDARQMSLWLLGAVMSHVADSATQSSGKPMHPLEAAEWAARLMNDHEPDERGTLDG